MRVFLIALTSLSFSFLSGCCREEVPQPSRPNDVRGWKEYRSGTVNFICSLVLKEGELSDNGKIGVQVLSIIPPDLCAESNSFLGNARAKLKVFSPADGQVVCEVTVLDRANTDLESSSYCGPNGILKVISVSAINTREKWIAFSLTD